MADRFELTNGKYCLTLTFYSERAVRATLSDHPNPRLSPVPEIVPEPEGVAAAFCEAGDTYLISTAEMAVRVDKGTLDIEYLDKNGGLVSAEGGAVFEKHPVYRTENGKTETRSTVDGERTGVTGGQRVLAREVPGARLEMSVADGERLYGLGCHEEGYADLNGRFLPLYQENMRVALPVIVSTRGYGYLYRCASLMTFDATEPGRGRLYFDAADAIDRFFILGGSFDGVSRELAAITGQTPMLPIWACGYVQSKERYKTAQELVDVASRYRRRGVPLDVIVQDWRYWREGQWGDKRFDPERYPEPERTMGELHDMGVHVMISVWPNMTGDSPDKKEFEDAGLMLSDGAFYNAFLPEARALYARQAFEGLFDKGIDGWWCDSSEPYDTVWDGAERPPLKERMRMSVEEFERTIEPELINAYSYYHSMGIYEAQRARSEKRVINLTRSGFPGQHKFAAVVWSGDVSAKWETLRRQVHCMQNYVVCGEAYWSCDAGGFFVKKGRQWFWNGDYEGGCQDPAYRELYTRWLQFSCFTPFMRSHGADTPREIWNFGEPGGEYYDAIAEAIRLRYRLLPYFYSVNAAVTFRGEMPLRPLALEFPEDPEAGEHADEYIYGHEFLVCPITAPREGGVSVRRVYLPRLPRGGWFDFYTESFHEGGQTLEVACGMDKIPVFVRAGSVIPMLSAPVQSTDEAREKNVPYEIAVYPGDDGAFTLYEDAGDGYGYEKGEWSMRRIEYRDAEGAVSETPSGDPRFRRPASFRTVRRGR